MTTHEIVPQTQDRTMEPRSKEALQREGTRPGWTFRPDVDIVEQPDAYLVTADLPGVSQEDVQVQLENGVLSIDGRPSLQPEPAWNALHTEYRIGGYHREFAMSDAIDVESISARMRDGVLEIQLPKTKRHQLRRIEIAS